jgi:hypothetical protein
MYKKITHNIVEEHFDHPMAAKIKDGLRTRRVNPNENNIVFGKPTNEIFNKTIFNTNMETYFNNYAQKLIQISDTTSGTEEQLVTAFEELFDSIDNVADFFNPFYNRELGERVSTSMRHIGLTLTMIVHSTKVGWDSAPWIRSLNLSLDLAPFQSYNTKWLPEYLRNTIYKFNSSMIARITAVKNQNQVVIDQSTEDAYAAMMIFKDFIANGIIQQFPDRFTE